MADVSLSCVTALLGLVLCWCLAALVATLARQRAAAQLARAQLPFGDVLAAQLAGTALNRIVPLGGGLVLTHLHLLRRKGSQALIGYAVAGVGAHVLLVGAALGLFLTGVLPWHLPSAALLHVGAVLVATVLALLVAVGRWRPRWLVALRSALRTCGEHPRTMSSLVALQVLIPVLLGLGLCCAAALSGVHVAWPIVLVVYLMGTVLAGAVPAPGGIGPVEAALVAGLTMAGSGAGAAVAAVTLFRVVTHWIPVPLGLLALRRLGLGDWRSQIVLRGSSPRLRMLEA